MTAVVYLRDVDGTGSLHPCSKGDPGALPHVPALDTKAIEDILEEKLATALKADPADAPFGLDADAAEIWHRAQASAYQHALEMLPLQSFD